jgi:aconitate hydratase 2/2-methylisocitrate dehydratase
MADFFADYRSAAADRAKQGIPPVPLTPAQAIDVCRLLEQPPANEGAFLVELLRERVSPGVDPAAKVKAEWLGAIAHGDTKSPLVSAAAAVDMLGTMLGG